MNAHPHWSGSPPRSDCGGAAYSHFDVDDKAPGEQLLAWRERVGHVIDVIPSREQLQQPFSGAIDRFDIGRFVLTDCRTGPLLLDRSIARISRDNVRSFAFHLFVEGGADPLALHSAKHRGQSCRGGVLALDMDQPYRLLRHACRVITLFVPGVFLRDVFADPSAIHGRVIDGSRPMVRFIVEHSTSLAANIRHMRLEDAESALAAILRLIVMELGQQAGLVGGPRANARAEMFDRVRRYVRAHLEDADMSPERIVQLLALPRPTLYRLFQHEGGLGTFIRHVRLRCAVDELIRFPNLPVKDVAYSMGFKSASDFTRAFRRAYELAPQDIRAFRTGSTDGARRLIVSA